MNPELQQQMDRDRALVALDGAIVTVDLAEKDSTIPPAKIVFGTVGILLVTIKVCFLPFGDNLP